MNEQFLETLTQVAPRIFDEMDPSLAAFNTDTYKTSFENFLNKYVDLFSLVEKLTEEEKQTKVFYKHWFNKYLKVNLEHDASKYIYIGNYSNNQIKKIMRAMNHQ